MTQEEPLAYRRGSVLFPGILLLVVLLLIPLPLPVHAQEDWVITETPHFRVEAIKSHDPQASWYAAFVEQVHGELADLLAVSLDRSIRVRLYPTEEAYVAANPAAGRSHGILAHARPSGDEIGMALVRLEALPGPTRVAAFRHELAHLLLNQRSAGRLPIGLHEGIAQYVEQDPNTVADAQEGLRRAFPAGRLLPWSELNNSSVFMRQPEVGYPQSYAVVAYLAEQHGFGGFGRLLDALREEQDLPGAFQLAFGASIEDLERDWRAAVPKLATEGLPANILANGNLRPAQLAASEQRWADAAGLARAAEQFWRDVGNPTRSAEAHALAERADGIVGFQKSFAETRRMLNDGDYERAADTARIGMAQLPASVDPEQRRQLQALLDQSVAGVSGTIALREATQALESYRIADAQRLAALAEQQLLLVDNGEQAAQARAILVRAQQLQSMAAAGALVVAIVCGGALLAGRARVRSVPISRTSQPEIRL